MKRYDAQRVCDLVNFVLERPIKNGRDIVLPVVSVCVVHAWEEWHTRKRIVHWCERELKKAGFSNSKYPYRSVAKIPPEVENFVRQNEEWRRSGQYPML